MKKYQKIISCKFASSGHYRITILFRNKEYSGITTNMPAIDLYKSNNRGWKSAGNELYNEVIRKNILN